MAEKFKSVKDRKVTDKIASKQDKSLPKEIAEDVKLNEG